ncbi:transglycosylase SLT domain-containing protein [Paludibaculum fermentans]|uniref:Transglycosylase SLT domain-containing protein n=1 Tax=Paludibaculum fermentans TaxID=1473598 RepID=A0A7S7SMG2_PALFE|nr:transglycosylase SLT domain-containing protein [Paludibaculum fermentans]QOY90414.1 transglycosylase SLT domain-containing protein [Paludibaculum fermentans]
MAAAKAEEPAEPASNPYVNLKQPALLLPKEISADSLTPSQKAVRDSDKHFQYGKFYIQEGKLDEARKEFNLAIDTLLDVPESAPDRSVAEKKSEELIRLIHRYDIESLGSGESPESPVFVQSNLPEILDRTFPIDPRLKDRTLAQVAAASSELPLTVNDAVLSYINYFTSERGRRVMIYGWKHAGRYKPMISRILDEEGVPQELISLAQAESGFVPRAVSRAAAAGMWQFVRSRGMEYGLNASALHDDRLDPEKATRAAAKHLRDLYSQLGDWYLAMAAYNCGPFCVERAVQRTGFADFWELRSRSALPRETMNYVPAILAMAIISKNPEAYGITPETPERAMEYDTVQTTCPTSLALVADAADLPVAEIRDLNPSLLRNLAPANYEVRVPKAKGSVVLAALESVPEPKRDSWRLHRVAEGETLTAIARRYSTAAGSIIAANARLDSSFFDAPESGEMLLIPASVQVQPVKRAVPSKARATAHRGYATTATRIHPASTKRVAVVSKTHKPISR